MNSDEKARFWAKWKDEPFKKYKVPIEGSIFSSWYTVYAPNKTIARWIAEGEVNPNIRVKGKIVEV